MKYNVDYDLYINYETMLITVCNYENNVDLCQNNKSKYDDELQY